MAKWKEFETQKGMTLRDWFAGRAINGNIREDRADEMAIAAYKVADAMIKARGDQNDKI